MNKERIYAYVDEFGAYGFDFNKDHVSTHFIVAAAIVNEIDKEQVISSVEKIRK